MTFSRSIAVFLSLCIVFISGCGGPTVKTMPDVGFLASTPEVPGPELRKKVGIMPLQNLTDYQDANLLRPLADQFIGSVKAVCPYADFIAASDSNAPSFLSAPPQTAAGIIDALALALKCRQNGFNAIITMSVTDIHYEKEMSWYNWLVKDDDTIFLNVRLEIYDTHTGSKFFHDTLIKKKEFNPLENESLTIPEIMALPYFDKMARDMAANLSVEICKTIRSTPWKGFIVVADGPKGVLSAGSAAGLKTNDILKVYKNTGIITGYGGLQYILPGPRVDQVRVTGVTKNSANIVSVSGKKLTLDNTVQY